MSTAASTQNSPIPARPHRLAGDGLALVCWIMLSFSPVFFAVGAGPGEWYRALSKPEWNPPNWIFGPVWTTLYLMMGIAAWRVWRRGGFAANARPLGLFLAQLVLNAAWTPIFFRFHLLGWALAEILLLWAFIAATIAAFFRRDKPAAYLLVPYLAWVSFASFLNFTLMRLNPS